MGLIGWTIYYIVLDGDVALTFNTRNLDEFVVDGKVLSEASPVFKALLASDLEAQRLRSAKNPQRLQIPDPKLLLGVKMLCLALHHYPYDILDVEKKAERRILPLLHLAHAARKYRAVDAMQRAISLRLLAPFEKRSLKEHDGSSQLDVDVAVIAYLLEQKDMFSVSTRRLIMDHCVPLSECGPEFLWVIPAVAICKFSHVLTHSEPMLIFVHSATRGTARRCQEKDRRHAPRSSYVSLQGLQFNSIRSQVSRRHRGKTPPSSRHVVVVRPPPHPQTGPRRHRFSGKFPPFRRQVR